VGENLSQALSSGKFAISLVSPYEQNEPFWDRQEDEEDEDGRIMFRYKTHAGANRAVTGLLKAAISKDVSRVSATGISFRHEVRGGKRIGMIFTIEKFDSNTHGNFDCWRARKKRADQAGSN